MIKTSTENFPKTLLRLLHDFHWLVRLYACHIPNNYHLAIWRNTPLLCWVTALPEAAVFLPQDYFATFLGAKTVICGNNAWRSGLQWSGGLKKFSQGFITLCCRPHKVDGIWHLLMCVFFVNPKANVAVLPTQYQMFSKSDRFIWRSHLEKKPIEMFGKEWAIQSWMLIRWTLCVTVKEDQARLFLLPIEPVSNNLKLSTGATLNMRLLMSCGVPQVFSS